MKDINYLIGKELNKIRKEKKISLEHVAKMSNMSISHLKNIENGNRGLTVDSLELFLNILNISEIDFFNKIK